MNPGSSTASATWLMRRAMLAAGLMVGFYVFGIAIAAAVALIPYLEYLAIDRISGRIAAMCWGAALAILWALVPRRDRFVAPGPRLEREQYPDLFAMIDDVAAATTLGCIALADGDLQPAELQLIRETYERAGYTDADLRIIGETLRGCTSTFNAQLFEHRTLYVTLRDACTRFAAASNEAARLELFRTAVRVALADNHATANEQKAVEACGTWLNVSNAEQEQVWRQHSVVLPGEMAGNRNT